MPSMDKDKVKKRSSGEKIFEQNEETKKIRKTTNGQNVKGKKEDEILEGEKVPRRWRHDKNVLNKTSLDVLLEGLTNVDLGEEWETMLTRSRLKNEEYKESPSTSRDSFSPVGKVNIAPKLPASLDTDDAMASDDLTSDESDFCPDWSSVDSLASSADSTEGAENGEEGGFPPQEIELQFCDDNFSRLRSSGSVDNAFFDVASLPVPAAGNEHERSMSSQTSTSDGRESPVAKFKPQAIRRVKSMIFEVSKDNEIDAEQRTRMLMRKHARDVTPSQIAMSLSPLLSAEDAGSLKRSPSQLSVKYCLKRSRSNLTVAENYVKRHPIFEGDVIHEESDDDASIITTDTDHGIEIAAENENLKIASQSSNS